MAEKSASLFETLQTQLASRNDAVHHQLAETRLAATEASQTANAVLRLLETNATVGTRSHDLSHVVPLTEVLARSLGGAKTEIGA